MRIPLLLALCCLTTTLSVFGQQTVPNNLLNHNILPLSPNAAALARYGEVPVGLYTGVPSVTVPLMTLQDRTVALPLSLQYHGGGVRVDEVAPWTGLGWSLNAGGAITRTCRGRDDFSTGGYFDPRYGPVPPSIPSNCDEATYRYVQRVFDGQLDTQPDLYNFNFPGYSGKIVFKQNGTPYTIPTQPLQIEVVRAVNSDVPTWKITAPDGSQYFFGTENGAETTRLNEDPEGGVSAWYLTRIISPQGDEIKLAYRSYDAQTQISVGSSQVEWYDATFGYEPSHKCERCDWGYDMSTVRPTSRILGKYLWRIRSPNFRVDLTSDNNRSDQPGTQPTDRLDIPDKGFRRLTRLRVTYLADSSRVQEFALAYNYSSTRLMLESVTESGLELATGLRAAKPPHRFAYNIGLPPLESNAKDRWGYYNGKFNPVPYPPYRDYRMARAGADRVCDPQAVTAGLLNQITYPTGGTTALEFEPHEFSNIGPDDSYTQAEAEVKACSLNIPGAVANNASTSSNSNLPTCNGPAAVEFDITHEHEVVFTFQAASYPATNDPNEPLPDLTDVDVSATLEARNAAGQFEPFNQGLNYAGNQIPNWDGTQRLRLPAGHYRLTALAVPTDNVVRVAVYAAFKVRTPKAIFGHYGGGTRIRRIVTYDGLDHARDQVQEYHYTNDAHDRSSGRLLHQPVFNSWQKIARKDMGGKEGTDAHGNPMCVTPTYMPYYCTYLVRHADDIAAAGGTAQGSQVGYDLVTVLKRYGNKVTKSQSAFRNAAPNTINLEDRLVENQGTVPANAYEDNGLLLQTKDFEVGAEGSDGWNPLQCRLVKQVDNTYTAMDQDVVYGLSLGSGLGQLELGDADACQGASPMAYSYRTLVGRWPLTRTQETTWGTVATAPFVTTTDLFYEPTIQHGQVTRKTVTTSEGHVQETRYRYAPDLAALPSAAVLNARHMLNLPLEEQVWLRDSPTAPARWTGGKATRYATVNGVVVPERVYVPALSAPASSATPYADVVSEAPASVYQPRVAFRYYAGGRLAQQQEVAGTPTSYVWGYNNALLIAEVKNATPAQIAYTGFEANSPGGWTFSAGACAPTPFTGTRGYPLGSAGAAPVRRSGLAGGVYQLDLWVHGTGEPTVTGGTQVRHEAGAIAGNWHQHRYALTVAANATLEIAATGLLWIDDVRLHPVEARMTTYTHAPLVGLTSQADPSGRTVTYEYDGLGRLLRTRDEQGRILSQQQYHYTQH